MSLYLKFNKKAKLLAATSASKSKGKKKKWSKGKLREKKNHRVVFTQALLDKCLKEVPRRMKVITVYNLIENYKINGSLARRLIKLLQQGTTVTTMAQSAKGPILTKGDVPEEEEKKVEKKTKGKPEKKEKKPKA